MYEVNEDESAKFLVTFYDENDDLIVPQSITYTIDCKTNGRQIRSATSVSAASSITITLTDADTCILDQGNKAEERELVIRAVHGAGDLKTERIRFKVHNLREPLVYKIVIGDDYLNADSRAFRSSGGLGWPVLTDGTVVLRLENGDDDPLEIEGTIVTATGNAKEVRFELVAEETSLLSDGEYSATIVATLTSGADVTLKTGKAVVKARRT